MIMIVTGCEYAGKSTLINKLMSWGEEHGFRFHLDDHFSIPDEYFLEEADQKAMLAMTPTIKERFQRFQIYYHISVMHNHPNTLLGGYHIEEAIYGPRYYYPGRRYPDYFRTVEGHFPEDAILLLLEASPEVIAKRMAEHPHKYNIIAQEDIPELLSAFAGEFEASSVQHKMRLDTSEMTPDETFQAFLAGVVGYLSPDDDVRRNLPAGT